MVRWMGVILLVALLLCGCTQEATPPTIPAEQDTQSTTSSQPATSLGLYTPGSIWEQTTAGAVRSFRLDGTGYYGCTLFGPDFLLMRQKDGIGEFSLYSNEELEFIKTVSLGKDVAPSIDQMQISQKGIAYLDSTNGSMVFLDSNLIETGRAYLPKERTGSAWLSPDWKNVYYCTDSGISVLNLQTHISRVLKEQTAVQQEITGGFGNGAVIRYVAELTEGQKQTYLIDGNSGIVLQEGAFFDELVTHGDYYFLPQSVSGVRQLRFGRGDTHQILWPLEKDATPQMLFQNNAVVMAQSQQNKITLSYYNLTNGNCTASVALDGITEIWSLQGDGRNGVWFFGRTTDNQELLYHWNTAKSQREDETIYTAPRFTLDAPDETGLAQCMEHAEQLGSKFGIDILIWKDAASIAPADYIFTEEYLTQVYDTYLPKLEALLSVFPDGFFKKTPGAKLQFALVSQISGQAAWGGLEDTNTLQYWKADTPIIALVLDEEFERNFYHGVAHFIDTQVLSKTSYFYEWNTLNPTNFVYDNSYITNQEREDSPYIYGGNRYFIDIFSMSYAKEDRARIMEYACLPNHEQYFETIIMQKKLQRICLGIREAFELKKVEGTFLWEQYLQN